MSENEGFYVVSAETDLAFENIRLATALRMAQGREVGEESLRAWNRLIAEKDEYRRALGRIHRICIEEPDAVAAATKAAEIAEEALVPKSQTTESTSGDQ